MNEAGNSFTSPLVGDHENGARRLFASPLVGEARGVRSTTRVRGIPACQRSWHSLSLKQDDLNILRPTPHPISLREIDLSHKGRGKKEIVLRIHIPIQGER